jgi:hypothetical protein
LLLNVESNRFLLALSYRVSFATGVIVAVSVAVAGVVVVSNVLANGVVIVAKRSLCNYIFANQQNRDQKS